MIYPIPLYLLDVHDVALSAAFFVLERWERPWHIPFVRSCTGEDHHEDVVAGTNVADFFLAEYSFRDAELETLARLPALQWVPSQFWQHIYGRYYQGSFWHEPDGSRVAHGKRYATIDGGVGEVFLFRYPLQAIFDFAIPLATDFADNLAPKSRRVYQDTSSRTFTSSWSFLACAATITGGAAIPEIGANQVVFDPDDPVPSRRIIEMLARKK